MNLRNELHIIAERLQFLQNSEHVSGRDEEHANQLMNQLGDARMAVEQARDSIEPGDDDLQAQQVHQQKLNEEHAIKYEAHLKDEQARIAKELAAKQQAGTGGAQLS